MAVSSCRFQRIPFGNVQVALGVQGSIPMLKLYCWRLLGIETQFATWREDLKRFVRACDSRQLSRNKYWSRFSQGLRDLIPSFDASSTGHSLTIKASNCQWIASLVR